MAHHPYIYLLTLMYHQHSRPLHPYTFLWGEADNLQLQGLLTCTELVFLGSRLPVGPLFEALLLWNDVEMVFRW